MDKKTPQDTSHKSEVKSSPLPKESGSAKKDDAFGKAPLKTDTKTGDNKYGSSKK